MYKTITIDHLIELIEPNQYIVVSMAAAEPKLFISSLSKIKKHIKLLNCLPIERMDYDSSVQKYIEFDSLFYSNQMRQLENSYKNVSYVPSLLHASGKNRLNRFPPDVYIGTGSKHPTDGTISMSLSNVYEIDAFKRAKIKVIELNHKMPYVFGDHIIQDKDIDYVINVDYEPNTINYETNDERDIKIAHYIANEIEDNSTLQFGIGSIPNAVAKALKDKRNLGIHTEMLSDGLIDLVKNDVVTGEKKSIYPRQHVCSFILGTKALYDYVHLNKDILLMSASTVNDPYVIGQNHKQISINTTIEIDLTGQCNSETLNFKHYSGTGGQSDTAVGAQRSIGGKSFIALHSTAKIKKADGTTQKISKIVPSFKNGTSVTLSRNDIDYVVTEYGIVKLKGLTIKERIHALISIADPEFKNELEVEAKKTYNI
jgi:acyl-CoA hydrolase